MVLSVLKCFKWKLYRCISWLIVEVIPPTLGKLDVHYRVQNSPATCVYPQPDPYPISWKSILTFLSHLRSVLPMLPFPFGFPAKTTCATFFSPIPATCHILRPPEWHSLRGTLQVTKFFVRQTLNRPTLPDNTVKILAPAKLRTQYIYLSN